MSFGMPWRIMYGDIPIMLFSNVLYCFSCCQVLIMRKNLSKTQDWSLFWKGNRSSYLDASFEAPGHFRVSFSLLNLSIAAGVQVCGEIFCKGWREANWYPWEVEWDGRLCTQWGNSTFWGWILYEPQHVADYFFDQLLGFLSLVSVVWQFVYLFWFLFSGIMQEIKFEPNVMCEPVDKKFTFKASQVWGHGFY